MKITHEKWGEVDGVELTLDDEPSFEWSKNGATYESANGWREVQEDKCVDVTGDVSVIYNGGCLVIPGGESPQHLYIFSGSRWRKTEMYDLPEEARVKWLQASERDVFKWINQFLKPCLIIEKLDE